MKKLKKTFQILALLIVLVIIFRAWIFRKSISYTPTGERLTILLIDQQILQELESEMRIQMELEAKNTTLSIEKIIQLAQKKTSEKLFFSKKSVKNPNIIIKEGKANCIGYAALFNSIAQFMLKSQQLEQQYQVNHLVGKIDLWGIDLHQFFNTPFFKDHDYNEIINLKTRHKIYIDPIVSDYFGIHQVSSKTD
jgi:hypothetical protein